MNKCEKCGKTFEGQSWQKICKVCFARSKNELVQPKIENQKELDTNKQIVRQTMFKVASRLLPQNTPASRVVEYAKQLETGFYS